MTGTYCQYINSPCKVAFDKPIPNSMFFAYPSYPETSVDALRKTIELLRKNPELGVTIFDWQELPIEGQDIFCEICRAIRKTGCLVANVTDVNFNVLFEFGYAVGLGKAIWPLVEANVTCGDRSYSRIQTLTKIGYSTFTNSGYLYNKMLKKRPWDRKSPTTMQVPSALGLELTRNTLAILYIKSPHNNEPSMRISEFLSLVPTEVIIDDPAETPFQPLFWYLNRIGKSCAVVVHLGNERIENIWNHWAKCALISGISLALGRRVLVIGEDVDFRPIDYHDLIRSYRKVIEAEKIVTEFISPINQDIRNYRDYMEDDFTKKVKPTESLLSSIDLGDYIAENEVDTLEGYFVETPQYQTALEPTCRVFVGRKGTGKSANSYMVLSNLSQHKKSAVCIIKPKEYELNEILDFVKTCLDKAKKGYVLESFWKFILLSEAVKTLYDKIQMKIALGLSDQESELFRYVDNRKVLFEQPFTTRLVLAVRELSRKFKTAGEIPLSEILHKNEIVKMHDLMCKCVGTDLDCFTILIDNLDANWHLGEDYEIMADILLALIGSSRDLWRSCKNSISGLSSGVRVSILIFLRTDIFRVVLDRARDPDKLQYELLFWENIDSLLKVIERRVRVSTGIGEDADLNWADILEPGFTKEAMTSLLSKNILIRPRDIIFYFQSALHYAKHRGTKYITKRDLESAMRDYSEHAFKSLCAESQPFIPDMEDLLLEFSESKSVLDMDGVNKIFSCSGISQDYFRKTLHFLLETNFLGYGTDKSSYRFPASPNEASIMLKRALRHSDQNDKARTFKIHKAFHSFLSIRG